MAVSPLLSVQNLSVSFSLKRPGLFQPRPVLQAVRNVSFDLLPGQTLGVVGESGCGKSTLARSLLGLEPTATGNIVFSGRHLLRHGQRMQAMQGARAMAAVFQDPLASLNPRMTVGELVSEPLRVSEPHLSKAERLARVATQLERVGLSAQQMNRYPHAFSGGQCQRIGIARALMTNPTLLICDEAVSALDVSVQAQIINLLMDLQAELGLTILFIAHDLSVVKHISDQVLVMYLGQAMEYGKASEVFKTPAHPYTQALLQAIPIADPTQKQQHRLPNQLNQALPSPLNLPRGCVFHPRCHASERTCTSQEQVLQSTASSGQQAACWKAQSVK